LIADIMNSISCCVVAGNIRRSSMIILGSMDDEEFINLKNYEMHPDRAEIGWTSNNSVVIDNEKDIENLVKIIPNIIKNGEPGIYNRMNAQQYARYGDKRNDDKVNESFFFFPSHEKQATLVNPCCFGPDTMILTVDGPLKISRIDHEFIAIVNGHGYFFLLTLRF